MVVEGVGLEVEWEEDVFENGLRFGFGGGIEMWLGGNVVVG